MLRALLRTPGVAGPFAAATIGRIPVTAIGLVLVLHVENLTGSFATAGATAGAFSLGVSASAPILGRLIDRRGQALVVAVCGAVVVAALTAIALLPSSAPIPVIALLAALSGLSMPPLGSCLRALWMHAIAPDRRHAAFAIDSGVTEVTYVIGPVVLAGAIGGWSTRAALGTAAALVALGAAVYATRPAVRAWRGPQREPSLLGPLVAPAVRSLLGMLAFLGVVFGAVEVGVAAVAEHAGAEAWAGPLLGFWAIGSVAGAVIAARSGAPADPSRRVVVLIALLALGHLPLVLPGEPLVLAPLLVLGGLTIAPTLATIFALLGDAAPAGTVTEAFTWATTAIVGGIATGATVGGSVADAGHGAPFAVAASAGLLATAFGAVRRSTVAAAVPAA